MIYNIPATNSFLDVLAQHFLNEYQNKPQELPGVLFLLPNRRACKAMADAFVRLQGLKPTMLPKMLPLAEAEEDELLITGFDLSEKLSDLAPVMASTERLMLFTKIIMSKPADYGLEKMPAGQAAALAKELVRLMDLTINQDLSFDALYDIVPSEYAAHWQETLKFLQIITLYWPKILSDNGKIDAAEYKKRLLKAQIALWRQHPPRQRIVVAGTTAAFPLMKEMVKTVCGLENGDVFLYGLDRVLSDDDWLQVDEVHPQFELKALLDYLQIKRNEVCDFIPASDKGREYMLSELMRPAVTSDKWRDIDNSAIQGDALSGVHLVNCRDMREEALSIALMMREVLEVPEKTAALVTTDRNLARRVAAELARWHIEVDDSAGKPLALTPVGIFLRLVIQAAEQKVAPTVVLSLMKHPLFGNGKSYFETRKEVREYERRFLRNKKNEEVCVFENEFQEKIGKFLHCFEENKISLKILVRTHLEIAELLAATNEKSGDRILWKGEDGETAARFMADVLDYAEVLGEIHPCEYAGLLEALMSGTAVRSRYGTHPRLKILGPIEARLQNFDRVIVGGVNENVWPQAVQADPWMSRPMKKDFGLPLPEKNIGVLAADFSMLLANKEVFLTRAERVQGTPTVKSRWWMRLETILQAAGLKPETLEDNRYKHWALYLDKAEALKRILPAAPRPPVSARPRVLSASAVENWMRDPYIIFAKYILKLKPLDEPEADLTFADYGTIIHAVLEEFNNKYSSAYPVHAKEELLKLGEAYFAKNKIAAETKAFWWPNFVKTAEWITDKENSYRQDIERVYNELTGKFEFESPAGTFTITAKADRVDVKKSGGINIIDYKTGQARSAKEIEHSYAPQLPIEALIAEKGGFDGLPAAKAEALIYWQLGRKESGVFDNIEVVLQNTFERIRKLAALFDFEDTPYISKPNPKIAPKYSDYEHLSRVAETDTEVE